LEEGGAEPSQTSLKVWQGENGTCGEEVRKSGVGDSLGRNPPKERGLSLGERASAGEV